MVLLSIGIIYIAINIIEGISSEHKALWIERKGGIIIQIMEAQRRLSSLLLELSIKS